MAPHGSGQLARLSAADRAAALSALEELVAAGLTAIDDTAALAASCRAGADALAPGAAAEAPPAGTDTAPRSARLEPLLSRLPQDALRRLAVVLDELVRLELTSVPDCAALSSQLSIAGTPSATVQESIPQATEFHDDPERMFEGDYEIADCEICTAMIAEDRFEPHWANGIEPEGSKPARLSTASALVDRVPSSGGRTSSSGLAGQGKQSTSASVPADNNTASPRSVVETQKVRRGEDEQGNKTINEYSVLTELGRGAYGKVKLVVHMNTNLHYAIKIMNKSVLSKIKKGPAVAGASTALDDALREIAIMKRLEHPNVVKLHEVIDDPECNKLYLILDFVERGPVMKLSTDPSKPGRPLAVSKIRDHLADICQGLDYLHFNNIIHRDIKPDNILVAEDGVAKLTDFGVSHSVDKADSASRGEGAIIEDTEGTPAFLTPEQLQQEKIPAHMADLWALGVTLYCMTFGRPPFAGDNFQELVANIIRCAPPYQMQEPWEDMNTDDQLVDLLRQLMHKELAKRVGNAQGVRDVLLHDFLKGHPNAALREHGEKVQVTAEDAANAVLTGYDIVLNFGNAVGVMMQTKAAVRGFKGILGKKHQPQPPPGAMPMPSIRAQASAAGTEAAAALGISITDHSNNKTPEQPPARKRQVSLPQAEPAEKRKGPELVLSLEDAEKSIVNVQESGGDNDSEGRAASDVFCPDSPTSRGRGAQSLMPNPPTRPAGGTGGGAVRMGGSFCGPRLTSKRSFRTEEEVIMEEQQEGDVNGLIEHAQQLSLDELTLNCHKFEHFPDSLFALTQLERLTSHLNGLKAVPQRICELQNLSYLNLGQNELVRLPPEIGRLAQLTHLDLNRNRLLELPEEIGDLAALRTINLDYNRLDELPRALTRIKLLEKCYMVQNEDIVVFPDSIGEWEAVTLAVTNTPMLLGHWAIKQHKYPNVTILWDKTYPDQVTEHVFLGSLRTTQTEKVFRVHNITAIVTAGKGLQVIDPLPQGVEQLLLNVDDSPDQTLVPFFEQVNEYINRMAQEDRRVLVHCFAGLSRSVTFVCAYLMRQRRMTFKAALHLVKRARPAVNPNQGFRRQLIDYEEQLYGTRLPPDDIENWPNGPGVDPTQFRGS
eukprot:TRINITY_DN5201_c0_g1_i1.p1 TRINITY_DN5201_c0_g1~~TRINITY_DN5201_c0_g1_i1.p1  ORF type:complete len:1113 (+),score=233.75 TRINITY_DN5201_c0_g1_i1:118-3456(+)